MQAKPLLKIDFCNFWPNFQKTDNYFFNLLSENFTIEVSNDPDILFFSSYGSVALHCRYKCTKVFFASENVRPPYKYCDFSFSFDYSNNKKNYRLPLYILYGNIEELTKRQIDESTIIKEKKHFCCFLVSNSDCETRNNFFLKLSERKHVDSGGKTFNNIGYLVGDKIKFIRSYKFVIAFENSSYPGYTTEKIYEPLQQHCIPIYWGNPLIRKDFNEKSFINCHNYSSFDEVIDHILAVDQDDTLYKNYLQQPPLENDSIPDYLTKKNIMDRMEEIIAFSRKRKSLYIYAIRPVYCFFDNRITLYSTRFFRKLKRYRNT